MTKRLAKLIADYERGEATFAAELALWVDGPRPSPFVFWYPARALAKEVLKRHKKGLLT